MATATSEVFPLFVKDGQSFIRADTGQGIPGSHENNFIETLKKRFVKIFWVY